MPLHGFMYTRAFIFVLNTLRLSQACLFAHKWYRASKSPATAPEKVQSSDQDQRAEQYRFAYTMAVIGAGLVSLTRCHEKSAKLIYILLIFCLEPLGQWVEMKHHVIRYADST